MLMFLLLVFLSFLLPLIVYFSSFMLYFTKSPSRECSSPFECGFDPKSGARVPFSSRFFSLAVLFLVFDVEVVILYPLPLTSGFSAPLVLGLSAFLLLLAVGLFHEWREGSLEWAQ